jgi:hypothetical protein
MTMVHVNAGSDRAGSNYVVNTHVPLYTREAFRAILARQPEWKIRAALEEGNIPSSNIEHAVEWLEEQAHQHTGYWS